jgi:hypothetical protein
MADRKTYSIYNMERKKVVWRNVEKQNVLQDLKCQHVTYNSRMVQENKIKKKGTKELQWATVYNILHEINKL